MKPVYAWSVLPVILILNTAGFSQSATNRMATAYRLLQRADSLFYQGEWQQAREQYLVCLADTSTNALAWNRLGYTNHQLGNYTDAIKYYRRSLENNPSPSLKTVVESRMARAFALENDPAQSISWLNRAIESGYSNVNEMDSSGDFKHLQRDPAFQSAYRKAYAAAFPCSTDPRSRAFDFWLGEWDVYQSGTRILVGHSVVQKIAGECGLLENWTATVANNGKSINYFDQATGQWEQDWVGSGGGAQRFLHGEYRDSAMRFEYEAMTLSGAKYSGHFIFYNQGPDQVRQFQDMTTDGGKTYQVSYDFTYIRKK